MADRYEAADKLLWALMGPKPYQVMFQHFNQPYVAYIMDEHLFRPKPKAVEDIERLMDGVSYHDVPTDEMWWRALEEAVLHLYTGEVRLHAGATTAAQLADPMMG